MPGPNLIRTILKTSRFCWYQREAPMFVMREDTSTVESSGCWELTQTHKKINFATITAMGRQSGASGDMSGGQALSFNLRRPWTQDSELHSFEITSDGKREEARTWSRYQCIGSSWGPATLGALVTAWGWFLTSSFPLSFPIPILKFRCWSQALPTYAVFTNRVFKKQLIQAKVFPARSYTVWLMSLSNKEIKTQTDTKKKDAVKAQRKDWGAWKRSNQIAPFQTYFCRYWIHPPPGDCHRNPGERISGISHVLMGPIQYSFGSQ